jgi:hypothetical protein
VHLEKAVENYGVAKRQGQAAVALSRGLCDLDRNCVGVERRVEVASNVLSGLNGTPRFRVEERKTGGDQNEHIQHRNVPAVASTFGASLSLKCRRKVVGNQGQTVYIASGTRNLSIEGNCMIGDINQVTGRYEIDGIGNAWIPWIRSRPSTSS